jgi:hypothetical protein
VRLEDICKVGDLETYLGQSLPWYYPQVHGLRLHHTIRAVGLGMVGKLEQSALV